MGPGQQEERVETRRAGDLALERVARAVDPREVLVERRDVVPRFEERATRPRRRGCRDGAAGQQQRQTTCEGGAQEMSHRRKRSTAARLDQGRWARIVSTLCT